MVGGPIWKDKTFFFLDAQTTMFTKSQVFNNVVPSDAMRGGDFSAAGLTIKDPLLHTQLSYNGTANVIPPSMMQLHRPSICCNTFRTQTALRAPHRMRW